ncbi:MAG: hypothetical protein AAF645_05200 [Myxococcota bacterium]
MGRRLQSTVLVLLAPAMVASVACAGLGPPLLQVLLLRAGVPASKRAGLSAPLGLAVASFVGLGTLTIIVWGLSGWPLAASLALACVLHAAALAPFTFTMLELLGATESPTVEGSTHAWHALSAGKATLLVLLKALALPLGALAWGLAEGAGLSALSAFALASWTYGLLSALHVAHLRRAYATQVPTPTLPRRHGRWLGALVVCAGGVAVLLLVGSAVAAPAKPSSPPEGPELDLREPLIEADEHAIAIRMADGGGAGRVGRLRPAQADARLHLMMSGPHLAAVHGPPWERVEFTRQGVRVDDGVLRRLRINVGPIGLALAALTYLALFACLWTIGMVARELHRFRPVAGDGLGALEGRAEGDEGPLVFVATVLGEPRRWRMPDGASVKGVKAGEPLTLVGRFQQLSAGLREGVLPWPEGGECFVGDRTRAAEAALGRRLGPAYVVAALGTATGLGALVAGAVRLLTI